MLSAMPIGGLNGGVIGHAPLRESPDAAFDVVLGILEFEVLSAFDVGYGFIDGDVDGLGAIAFFGDGDLRRSNSDAGD